VRCSRAQAENGCWDAFPPRAVSHREFATGFVQPGRFEWEFSVELGGITGRNLPIHMRDTSTMIDSTSVLG